jgi:gliding motility-associated lipoprotein GldH
MASAANREESNRMRSNKNKYINNSYKILIIIFLFIACQQNLSYEKYISIDRESWNSAQKLFFPVEIKDTSVLYNIYINVRNTNDYPFSNLWLNIGTKFPDNQSFEKRINLTLADSSGKWLGQPQGDLNDEKILIQQNAFFQKPGTYTFSLEQIMRQDPLPGILAIGLRVENTQIKRSLHSRN